MRKRLILKRDCVQTTQLEVGRAKSQSKDGSVKWERRDRCSQGDHEGEVDPGRGNSHLLSHVWCHWATRVAPSGILCAAGQGKRLNVLVSVWGL